MNVEAGTLNGASAWARDRFKNGLITFEELHNPQRMEKFESLEPVAFHEEGHAGMARFLGRTVNLVKVFNSTSGVTLVSSPSELSPQGLKDNIAISAAGEMAEEMNGITDHSGCGFDRGKQRFLARILQIITGTARSIGSIISEQRSRASSVLSEIGFGAHMQRSMSLVRACA